MGIEEAHLEMQQLSVIVVVRDAGGEDLRAISFLCNS